MTSKLIRAGSGLGALFAVVTCLSMTGCGGSTHLGPSAWDKEQWTKKTKGIRTSYNPDHDLSAEELTLVPGDERWLDFVYWCFASRVTEHQIEAYGGTGWNGPTGGVIFHWAPGSRWETHTLGSFGFAIGHLAGELRWRDTQFPHFFEKYGGVYGVNVKDRLAEIDPESSRPWVEFLTYIGDIENGYSRYISHREQYIDPVNRKIYLSGGQGAGLTYTFERYYHEVREILTDASACEFFQMYDLYGPGFASRGNWARQGLPETLVQHLHYMDEGKETDGGQPGVAESERYDPDPPAPEIPSDYPMYADMRAGQELYNQQCTPCHGIQGDGKGFLAAGLDVKPRDFRQGTYKFRTTQSGELPTIEDIEHTIRVGVPNSTMPTWGQFLNDQQIHQLALYVTVFADYFLEAMQLGEEPYKIEVAARVDAPRDQLLAEGKELYEQLECWKCHGQQGKGDGPSAPELEDSWEEHIRAADLTYKWNFKNGYTAEDIHRTFIGGLDGTPMPSYLEAFNALSALNSNGGSGTAADTRPRWALVEYVLSLSPKERPVVRLKDFKSRIPADLDEFGVVRSRDH